MNVLSAVFDCPDTDRLIDCPTPVCQVLNTVCAYKQLHHFLHDIPLCKGFLISRNGDVAVCCDWIPILHSTVGV